MPWNRCYGDGRADGLFDNISDLRNSLVPCPFDGCKIDSSLCTFCPEPVTFFMVSSLCVLFC
jgi:hypothetical protein